MNRRNFARLAAIAAASSALPKFGFAQAKGSDRIKVGLVGCGGRGTDAACNMMAADQNIKFVAFADLFEDKIAPSVDKIRAFAVKNYSDKASDIIESEKVKRFHGWDAIDQLLAEDVDVVINATPPVFRTPHYVKIVAAGKHAFLEKPACIDITQARTMLALADEAKAKNLAVVCGTQRRYHEGYREIVKRVQDGMIGDPLAAYAYWNESTYIGYGQHNHGELPYDTMEYQVRNWFSFIWTSGDHIVEQHVHNLDVIMWALGDNRQPIDVRAWGGRSTDLETPKYGDRFSHFVCDFDMGNGLRLESFCQQDPKTQSEVCERIVGTKGIMKTMLWGGRCHITDLKGNLIYEAPDTGNQCLINEHKYLLDSIRNGKPANELKNMINSNLLAVAGRMSAFSGQKFKYGWMLKRSKESLEPKEYKFGKYPLTSVPVPGKYKLV